MRGSVTLMGKRNKQPYFSVGIQKKENIMDHEYETERLWDWLIETRTATKRELDLVTIISGKTLDTLESVLFSRDGQEGFRAWRKYRSEEKINEIEGEE